MKKIAVMFAFFCCLLLFSACAWIEGNTHSASPHVFIPRPDPAQDGHQIVQTQQQLEQLILQMVRSRVEMEPVLIESEDYQTLLDDAVHNVTDNPLYTYAVHVLTPRLGESRSDGIEVELNIRYRKSQEQIQRVGHMLTEAELSRRIGQLLREGQDYFAFFGPADLGDRPFLEDMIRRSYFTQPLDVPVLPRANIRIHVTEPGVHIAEISLTFGQDTDRLAEMREQIRTEAETILQNIPSGQNGMHELTIAWWHMLEMVTILPSEQEIALPDLAEVRLLTHTAHSALIDQAATAEGALMAALVLAQLSDFAVDIVYGTHQNTPHAWLEIQMDELFYFDLFASFDEMNETMPFFTRAQMESRGYDW